MSDINWVAFTAIATFLASFVALFGPWLRTLFFRPRLKMGLLDGKGELVKSRLDTKDENGAVLKTRLVDTRFFHLRVENDRKLRWPPVTDVRLLLLRVSEPGANGEFVPIWVGALPIACRHQEINPLVHKVGTAIDFDLCSVVREKWIQLHPLVRPLSNDMTWRRECHLELLIQACGVETDSSTYRVKIDWDYQWADGADEMKRHLSVSVEPVPMN